MVNITKRLLLVSALALAAISTFGKGLSEKEATEKADIQYLRTSVNLMKSLMDEWRTGMFVNGDDRMKFTTKIYGDKPFDGRSLYISLHGGGGTTAEANDKQWDNQKYLYTPAEGVYLVPRSPSNSWNMWHQGYMEEFLDKAITAAVLYEDVNPNKVYILGYSAGGDGLYQLAPRLADHWAAASMMAGHPGDASMLPLRNLPFAIFMGGKDAAYDRNILAAKFGSTLDSLEKDDPQGYKHMVHIYPELGHWMERRDTIAIPWMAEFRRNPYPEKVVWVQDDVPNNLFYWLEVPEIGMNQGSKVVASYKGNTVTIESSDSPVVIIGLNDKMMNLDTPVTIICDGKVVAKKTFSRKMSNIAHSLNARFDRDYIFPVRIMVDSKKVYEL